MEQNLNTELRLQNNIRDYHYLRVRPDDGYNGKSVCLNIVFEDKMINLCNINEVEDEDEGEYFHLDKFQIGCLIDYLKRLYDLMD